MKIAKIQTNKWISLLGAGAFVMVGLAGCTGADQDGDGKTADTPEGKAIQNTVDSAQKSAGDAAETVGDAASNVASGAANAVKNLDDAAAITPKVKTAFANNASLAGSNINVDTTNESVTLSGSVKNAAQMKLAGEIAKKNAAGYKIVNNLKMSGGASPKMKKQ